MNPTLTLMPIHLQILIILRHARLPILTPTSQRIIVPHHALLTQRISGETDSSGSGGEVEGSAGGGRNGGGGGGGVLTDGAGEGSDSVSEHDVGFCDALDGL